MDGTTSSSLAGAWLVNLTLCMALRNTSLSNVRSTPLNVKTRSLALAVVVEPGVFFTLGAPSSATFAAAGDR